MMSSSKLSDKFKRDAVAQFSERGNPSIERTERLGVGQYTSFPRRRSRMRRHVTLKRTRRTGS